MALLVQGFGTAYVGQRDFARDGSYLTTEWIVLFLVPVLPLRTLRVSSLGRTGSVFYQKEDFVIHKRMPPQVRQVLCVYAFTVCYVAYLFAALWVCVAYTEFDGRAWLGFIGFVAVVVAPLVVPFSLRRRAQKRRLTSQPQA